MNNFQLETNHTLPMQAWSYLVGESIHWAYAIGGREH